MIKFFRKIRQRLLSENKFSKYLIYATGEIVLVVIGILIALQINNWNEQRKERKLEVQIYTELKSDLLQTRNDINEAISKHKEIFKSSQIEKSKNFKKRQKHQNTSKNAQKRQKKLGGHCERIFLRAAADNVF